MESLKDQVGGNHYHKLHIQPIEYITANQLGYCEGNIVKYVTRWKDKGGLEDLLKAQQYLAFLIEAQSTGPDMIVTDTDPGDEIEDLVALSLVDERLAGDTRPGGRRYDRAISDPYPNNFGGM